MLATIKDDDGNIMACAEWYCVNEQGFRTPQGSYIWVNELQVSQSYWNEGLIPLVILEIAKKTENKTYVYWRREKYDLRVRIYPREKLIDYAQRRLHSLV